MDGDEDENEEKGVFRPIEISSRDFESLAGKMQTKARMKVYTTLNAELISFFMLSAPFELCTLS